jgi:hypothetical protein
MFIFKHFKGYIFLSKDKGAIMLVNDQNSNREKMVIKAIKDSIDHWKRMIEWAEKQPKNITCFSISMDKAIGENWYRRDCPLCSLFYYKTMKYCCPLTKVDTKVRGLCITSWIQVYKAKTWKEWVKAAYKMLSILKKCLKNERKTDET